MTVPVLIVQGTTDLQVTVDDAKRLPAAKSKSEVASDRRDEPRTPGSLDDRDKQIASYSNPDLRLAPEFFGGRRRFCPEGGEAKTAYSSLFIRQ
ncbi:MAG TPA: hypothetical protein VGQ21_20105 [Thermoanaerobaculia bacterium]|nr:hypothetical protein [Thermoanaerobaculia bacterium]